MADAGSECRLMVVTGGPCSGKTTLVEALAGEGFETLPEVAIQVIGELNELLGLEEQKRWRHSHRDEFQTRVAERQFEFERAALAAGTDRRPIFLDRGLLDGLAYCRHFQQTPPARLLELTAGVRYSGVFLLDTLDCFDERLASGRTSDRQASIELGRKLAAVYRDYGYEPVRLPELPLEERLQLVLERLGDR